MHFAAYTYVNESVKYPERYYNNNTIGTLNLLETMKNCGIDKLIFSSTCATCGIPDQSPIPESHPQHPINPYGRSKLMNEWVLKDIASTHGLRD
jgi:UDP-glucose 4-epimerase